MFILIDNYDSFTWNLWHFLSDLGAEVEIIRNDVVTVDAVLAQRPEGLILSPGPGTPEDAGILIELIRAAAGSVPVLGVCLGHQALRWPLVAGCCALTRRFTASCRGSGAAMPTPWQPTSSPIARRISR